MEKLDKESLRRKYSTIRRGVLDKDIKSKEICEKIINSEEYKMSEIILIYSAVPYEVDSKILIKHALKDGKTVCVPKVMEDNSLNLYTIQNLKDLVTVEGVKFKEPKVLENEANKINIESVDLAIVPGICFDTWKYRLGFGGGSFDRLLEYSHCYKVGVCFDVQILTKGSLPTENHDVCMNKIVTEKRELF